MSEHGPELFAAYLEELREAVKLTLAQANQLNSCHPRIIATHPYSNASAFATAIFVRLRCLRNSISVAGATCGATNTRSSADCIALLCESQRLLLVVVPQLHDRRR